MLYPSIRIEGNIISQEILSKLEQGEYPGQMPRDFGFTGRSKVKDEIAFAWATAKDYWRIFHRKLERLASDETATSETRADWMKPFLQLLGYEIEYSKSEMHHDKTYPISHRDMNIGGFPIHIVSYRDDLDRKRADGGYRMSPHGLLQEYLNVSEHLYGLVSNGHYLRLLRDSGRLVKLSFAEFDLQRMMEDDLYSDFAILFRLLHRSRMPKAMHLGDESLIEQYHQDALDAGTRIRQLLSSAVERSIIQLANGFLQNPDNKSLHTLIETNKLTSEAFYQNLLRLIYRFLFLMVTEERDLIFPDGDQTGREIYYNYYSFQRLRKLCEKPRYGENRFDDLWEGLKTTFKFFESESYGHKLDIQPLDGDLFGADALGVLTNCRLKNDIVLECLRNLNEFTDDRGVRIRVNYGSLDVEEFGSLYEGLLEYDLLLTKASEGWSFQFQEGKRRSASGSHYTPEELVQPLIKHSLDHVIQQRLKTADGLQDKETAFQAKRNALLSIKVCDPACGSGHMLLSAARRIATVLAQTTTGEEQPSPSSFRAAIREVVGHCIYGVDMNPLAVELCKVALWLEAHNPGMPLTFLDHRILCGDSIVGLARHEDLQRGINNDVFKALPGDNKLAVSSLRRQNKRERELRLERESRLAQAKTAEERKATPGIQLKLDSQKRIEDELGFLATKNIELEEKPNDTIEDFQNKRDFFKSVRGEAYNRLKAIADLQIAQFFIRKVDANLEYLVTDRQYFEAIENERVLKGRHVENAKTLSSVKRFFHWFLEFPEVFTRGGFDVVIGNPPFLGGQRLSGAFGDDYLQYLRVMFAPIGAVDIVTYFFRRAFDLLSPHGFQALLATNTIAQGDARDGGLEVITRRGGSINYAVRSMRWPGTAAVQVSQVVIHKGPWEKDKVLGTKTVKHISTYLDDDEDLSKPFRLLQNASKSFQGSIVLGKGFILTPKQAEELISKNPKNKDVLFPYLNGEDLNSRPDQSPSRWVINFFDWPLDRTAEGSWKNSDDDQKNGWLRKGIVPLDYPEPVAADYPDCLSIVERLVKPERQRKDSTGNYVLRRPLPDRWWHYGEKRPALYRTIAPLKRALVIAQVSKTVAFAFTDTDKVLDAKLIVLAFDGYDIFCVLQSSLHYVWAWKYTTTMKTDLCYMPTVMFENFPLPMIHTEILSEIGKSYYVARQDLMRRLNLGLTKAHNLFHNSKLTPSIVSKESRQSPDIAEQAYQEILKLRQLHKEMDEAVLAAYGWSDLDLEHGFHEVEYLPEDDRIRFTISESARKEVLRRLLRLNHEIHQEEMRKADLLQVSRNLTKKQLADTLTRDLFKDFQ